MITAPQRIFVRRWIVPLSQVQQRAALRQGDERLSRGGRPGCPERCRELVVVVGLAFVRVAMERGCDRLVMVVRGGVV